MSPDEERRQAEMARGREVAARHAAENGPKPLEERLEILARYVEIRDPASTHGRHKHPFHLVHEGKNKVAYINNERIAAEVTGPAFPSDSFTAQCILAVNALIPPEWVPDYSPEKQAKINERKRRDEARKHVIDWKKYPDGNTWKR